MSMGRDVWMGRDVVKGDSTFNGAGVNKDFWRVCPPPPFPVHLELNILHFNCVTPHPPHFELLMPLPPALQIIFTPLPHYLKYEIALIDISNVQFIVTTIHCWRDTYE